MDDGLGNGQPQAVAAVAGPGLVTAVKPLEDMGQVLPGDPPAGVVDLDGKPPPLPLQLHRHLASAAAVFEGIVQQNRHQLPDPGRIAGVQVSLRDLHGITDILLEGHALKGQRGLIDRLGQGKADPLLRRFHAIFQAGHVQHLADQPLHPLCLGPDTGNILVLSQLILQHGSVDADGGKGRFEFVSGTGDELLLLFEGRHGRSEDQLGEKDAYQDHEQQDRHS